MQVGSHSSALHASWPDSAAKQSATVAAIGAGALAVTLGIKMKSISVLPGLVLAGGIAVAGAAATSKLMTAGNWNPFESTLMLGGGGAVAVGLGVLAITSSKHVGGTLELGAALGFGSMAAWAAGSVVGATTTAIVH